MSEQGNRVIFREVQWLYQIWWLVLLIAGLVVFIWYGFIQQIILGQPFGDNPASDWGMWVMWLFFGIALPLLWLLVRLIVEVREDHIYLRYTPFLTRRIPLVEIERWEARSYAPIREFGGWGIRWGFGKKRAYSVSGYQGVELTLRDGQRIMIGSQRAEELAEAISSVAGTKN